MYRLTRLFCFVISLFAASTAMAEETWKILPNQAACLIDNVEAYKDAAGGKPAVIFLQYCPTTDTAEVMRKMQTNSGALPSVTVAPDGSPLDDVIVYSQAELVCLEELQLDLETSPVVLPRKPCAP